MADSRESSPASVSSPSFSLQLTPNSKVKALTASFDNDSDESDGSVSARTKLKAALTKNSSPNPSIGKAKQSASSTVPQENAHVSDDESEEDIVRPKGRMAARMLASVDDSGDERRQASSDMWESVNNMQTSRTAFPGTTSDKGNAEGSEASEVPVSRKRKIRTTRPTTPTASPRNRSASLGLFVSPAAPRTGASLGSGSDSDELPAMPNTSNASFLALVEKRKREVKDREAEAAAEKARKKAEREKQIALLMESEDASDDEDAGRRLTQQNRPTRKASKKALDDIGRETERMKRNMQLTHKATTKKKFSTGDLLKRFNYNNTGHKVEESHHSASSSSPAHHSDGDVKNTPPSSPPDEDSFGKEVPAVDEATILGAVNDDGQDLLNLNEVYASSPPRKLGKGKGKATEAPEPSPKSQEPKKKYTFKQRSIRIRLPKLVERESSTMADSDSDLEIMSEIPNAKKKKVDAIFERAPKKQATESRSMHVLKILSHQSSPGKQSLGRNKKPSITTVELHTNLQKRARQQAARADQERLQALRDKGIIVPTAEERQKEMAEAEDLFSKARREGEAIRQREKAAAKKERKANGEVDPIGDSSDDEDWEEEKQHLVEELSGSDLDGDESEEGNDASGEDEEDEEDDEDAMDVDGDDETAVSNPLFDNEADESDDDEAEADLSMNQATGGPMDLDDEEEDEVTARPNVHRMRKSNVISDDEVDEEDSVAETPLARKFNSPTQLHKHSPAAPNSVLRSATKTFIPGVTVSGVAGLGLTQIFAGTMDESQLDLDDTSQATPSQVSPQMQNRSDAMSFLKRLPAPELPPFLPTPVMDSQDVVMNSQPQLDQIPESQTIESQTQGIQLDFSQSQIHGFDSLIDPQASQMSEFPEPTQDVGFQHMTPIRGRFADAPPSTVDTVLIALSPMLESVEEIPIVKKKGKLRRRAPIIHFSDEEDAGEAETAAVETFEDDFDISANAFDVMRKASKKKVVIVDEFDKKKSEAKNMVNEQAEESEDEYAGLGGASDDDSGGEEDEFVKEMIDDEGGKNVNERKLAAFYA